MRWGPVVPKQKAHRTPAPGPRGLVALLAMGREPKMGSFHRPEDQLIFDEYVLKDFLRFTGGRKVIDYFRDMDADGSGAVTQKEFGKAVKALGFVHATKEATDAAFKALDTDGNGKIDYLELDKRLRRLGEPPAREPIPEPSSTCSSSLPAPSTSRDPRLEAPAAAPRQGTARWARQALGGFMSGRDGAHADSDAKGATSLFDTPYERGVTLLARSLLFSARSPSSRRQRPPPRNGLPGGRLAERRLQVESRVAASCARAEEARQATAKAAEARRRVAREAALAMAQRATKAPLETLLPMRLEARVAGSTDREAEYQLWVEQLEAEALIEQNEDDERERRGQLRAAQLRAEHASDRDGVWAAWLYGGTPAPPSTRRCTDSCVIL